MNLLSKIQLIKNLAACFVALLIVAPLTGVPPSIGGIPVWYQDTFFWGLLVMGIVGIITVGLYWIGKLKHVRWNMIDMAVFGLFIYMAIRTYMMEFIPQSAWIQMAYLEGLYVISRVLWPSLNAKSFILLMVIVLGAGIIQAGYGLGQLYEWWPSHHNIFPMTGTFFNPGPYSGWLACLVPVAVYGIHQYKFLTTNKLIKYLCWTYLFLAALVLFPASSRAAILASIIGTVVVAWSRIKKIELWQRSWVKGTIAVILFTCISGLYYLKKDSADGRLLIYKITSDMIAGAPIFGWGWDGFPRMYNNFQAVYFQNGYGTEREKYLADNVTYGFNEVLEFTAEMGIVGLLLALIIVVQVIRKWRQRVRTQDIRPIHYLGLGVLMTWIMFALFSYPISVPALALVLPVGLSGIVAVLNNKKITEESVPEKGYNNATSGKAIISFAGFILLGICAYVFYWVNHYRPMVNDWITANANHELQRYEIANSLYTKIYPEFRNEGLFLQFAGKSHSLMRKYYSSGQFLERALFFSADPTIFTTLGKDYTLFRVDKQKKERAEFLLTRAKHISPYKYYPRYLLVKYYEQLGSDQKALN